jgi:hypothetical protein
LFPLPQWGSIPEKYLAFLAGSGNIK